MYKKLFKVFKGLTSTIFMLFCVFAVFISFTIKKNNDDATTIFGYQLRFVISNSMEKHENTDVSSYKIKDIPLKSLLVIKKISDEEDERDDFLKKIKIGDVLTFKYVYSKQETITHRVVNIEQKDSGFLIYLKGDNLNSNIETLTQVIDTSDFESPNYIIGKVVAVNVFLGSIIYALNRPVGMLLIIIIPCLILMIFEIIKIIYIFKNNNINGKIESDHLEEIERLKKELESLKAIKKD